MRESNFAFPSQNRACVCITSQLYDRRALDTTSPLPLFNSLTHLTYLTSTSPRIREIMTMDGGLERLVRILQDFCICPPPPENASLVYGLSPPSLRPPRLPPTLNPPSYDKHAAYRFSLAFQCVVNIGVRGSEPIRSRVVQAGTLQVVGCILEAWLANKGFAVGPSSSATGLPRESREQRHARRVAMQEMRQREEAMELDRALQRSIHLSQGHGGGQGRGLLLPASTSASTPSEDADGDADEESATDNSTAATPQGAHTPTTTASSSFPHTHAHPQPARDRSGTIIATTRRARPPLTHRPSSPSDSSRPETETEREEEEGTDVDMAGPSRGGTIRRPRRASANPHQHIIITDASDAPTIVGAIDTINITVDMDPIDPDDFGAGVMGARNDDFAMGAPPGAPGALERLVGVGGRRGESVSPSPSPGPGSVGPSSPSVGSAEGQPGAMDVDVDVEEVVSVDAEAEAGDADEETEMDGDDDEEMEVEVEGTPRRARRSRMSSGHSLSSTSGSGSGRHHGRRHAPDATPRAGSSGLPSVLERSGHSDSGVSSSGQSTSTSGYSGASTSGQSSASTSVSTASTSGHSTSTFGHSNGSTSAAAISVHGRTPTVPSATPRIVTATTTTTPTAVPRRTHLTHAHLHAVHTHPHAAHPHPHPAHPHHAHHHAHAHAPTDPTPGPYRDEDVLLSLQLLAYLSKYPHVRQAFYEPCRTFHPASRGTFYEVGKGESKEGKGKDASSSKVKGKDAAAASSGKGSEKEKDKGEEKEKGKANLAASTSAAPREGLSGFLRAFGSPSRGSGSSSRSGAAGLGVIGSGRPVLRGTGAASPARGSAQSSRGSPTNGTGSGTGPFGALTIPPYGGGSRRGQEKETQSHSGGKDSSKSSSSSASSTQAQASSSTKGDSPSSKPDSSSASSASHKASKDKEKDEPTLLPRQTNVFSLVERFTFRPSSSEADLPNPPPKLPVEIQYWAGVIMRNACRKDDSRGGIRQCANMLCGKWESYPREFAKCRRCRKAKYCGKECQSTAWSEGHRFWCSAKEPEEETGSGERTARGGGGGGSGSGGDASGDRRDREREERHGAAAAGAGGRTHGAAAATEGGVAGGQGMQRDRTIREREVPGAPLRIFTASQETLRNPSVGSTSTSTSDSTSTSASASSNPSPTSGSSNTSPTTLNTPTSTQAPNRGEMHLDELTGSGSSSGLANTRPPMQGQWASSPSSTESPTADPRSAAAWFNPASSSSSSQRAETGRRRAETITALPRRERDQQQQLSQSTNGTSCEGTGYTRVGVASGGGFEVGA